MTPKQKRDWIDEAKQRAAAEAVKHVKDNCIIGLGSGSTAAYAIKEIARKMNTQNLKIIAVPTSYQAFAIAIEHGIPTTTLEEHPNIDLTIDGADQIDNDLRLIKGMGGALAREKIVAAASRKNIVVADETKKVLTLGSRNQCVPIEIVPFALKPVTRGIARMNGKAILREGTGKVGPVVTDNGNFIIDSYFGEIHDPEKLADNLKTLTGVVETGLFIGLADLAYLGRRSGVEKLAGKRY